MNALDRCSGVTCELHLDDRDTSSDRGLVDRRQHSWLVQREPRPPFE